MKLERARRVPVPVGCKSRQPHLPIVLTTGYAESAASMKDGEFRVLLKPYSIEALSEALLADRR